MPGPSAHQQSRFELKYLVSESVARAMRSFVRCYLRPDEFATRQPDHSYPVHTLYLDSPELSLYQATVNGERNRYKLRIRYYEQGGNAPVYFEIKRRVNNAIVKQRARVCREAVAPVLAGEWPQTHHLITASAKQLAALQEFSRLMHHLQATPRSHVTYRREAWMSPADNSMRVTFDRQVRCEPAFDSTLRIDTGDAVTAFENEVIAELKFTGRMPAWCGEMIRGFQLVQQSVPKYVEGVALLGEDRVSNRGVGLELGASVRGAVAAPNERVMPAFAIERGV
jgi:SPX domain protein involved in polyphosphate accumulation